MSNKRILIVGIGLIGQLLAYELSKNQYNITLIGERNSNFASRISAGLINPLSGKKYGILKDYSPKLEAAFSLYEALEKDAQLQFIKPIELFKFTDEPISQQHNPYLKQIASKDIIQLENYFQDIKNIIKVNPCYQVQTSSLLNYLQRSLPNKIQLIDAHFDSQQLKINETTATYDGINYDAVIFCEGANVRNNPLWNQLKFTKNRGDVLLVKIPSLPNNAIYEMGFKIMPLYDDIFWVGSNNEWNYDDLLPNLNWKQSIITQLDKWLKLPYEILEHWVAERPTIAGQNPVYEQHPEHKQLWIINGLGTRGYSAGPYIIQQFLAKFSANAQQ